MAHAKYEGFDLNTTYKIVRELLQDEDLPEEDLRVFMRSQMFLELCPELHQAFVSSERVGSIKQEKKEVPGPSTKDSKSDKSGKVSTNKTEDGKLGDGKSEQQASSSKIKPVDSCSHKKKSKRKLLSSSDSDDGYSKPSKKDKSDDDVKKKKKIKLCVSSSGSSIISLKSIHQKPKQPVYKTEKPNNPKKSTDPDKSEAPKVHPFWLGKMGPAIESKGKLFEPEEDESETREKEREKREKERAKEKKIKKRHEERIIKKPIVREPTPRSVYSSSLAKIGRTNKNWKPFMHPDFNRKQKRHKLKVLSVICVDLLNLGTFFHNASLTGPPSCSTSVPLKRHMNISTERGEMVERLEKLQRESFKPTLNKLYRKSLKDRRTSRDDSSSTDGERGRKEKKTHNQRRVVNSSSDSSSDPILPKKGMHHSTRERESRGKEKINARKGTAEFKAEQRKKQLDKIKAKAEQRFNNRGSRKLSWEDPQYFDPKKSQKIPKKDDKLTAKEREKKRLENKLKFVKPNAPAISFQKILAQIESENKQAAKKPPVALKIPKLSERRNEYVKPSRPISVGDVANEVTKLLASESKVDVPLMPSNTMDLADYTIRKIAWWFLKSQKEPADDVLVHPELHDDEIFESWFQKNENDSDDSSVGCVSDPEGLNKCQVNEITSSSIDGDVTDEYCGLQSLESLIRRPGAKGVADVFKPFFKVRPGSNYEKANFEAKCFLCEEKVVGQRQLGAHIRSSSHKNHFRNYSLKLASYEESAVPVPHKILYTATLKDYAIKNPSITESAEAEPVRVKLQIDMKAGDSPRAMIDGESDSPEIVENNDIPDDELSLPSLTMFDLRADEEQLQAKITLRTNDKWTDEMELRWIKMQDEETRITEKYNDLREQYINAPDTHPRQPSEWMKFWDRRSCELEAEGKNPDQHDFGSEWVLFWLKRMQEIMKEDVEKEILTMKQNLKLDFQSLLKVVERSGLKLDIDENLRSKTSNSTVPKFISKKPEQALTSASVKNSHRVNPVVQQITENPDQSTLASIAPSNGYQKIEKNDVSQVTKKQDNAIFIKLEASLKLMEKSDKQIEAKEKGNDQVNVQRKEGVHANVNPIANQRINLKEPVCQQLDVKPKVEDLPKIKKIPVAPPPPKISLESKGWKPDYKEKEHSKTRRDSKDKRNIRDVRHRRDSRDERRQMSPDDGRSRRNFNNDTSKTSHIRSSSNEKRDRRNRDSRSDSDDWEPKSNTQKEVFKTEISTIPSLGIVGTETDKNLSEPVVLRVKGTIETYDNKKPKDLAAALEELREAMEFVEPIMGEISLINPIVSSVPAELENISEPGALLDGSLINTSVEMELENAPSENENVGFETSKPPIPKLTTSLDNVSPVQIESSAEEGEIASSVSSMGVDLTYVSSFMKTEIPGVGNLASLGKKPKWLPISDQSLKPSPSKLDPSSIGFHIFAQKRENKKDERRESFNDKRKKKKKKSKEKHFKSKRDYVEDSSKGPGPGFHETQKNKGQWNKNVPSNSKKNHGSHFKTYPNEGNPNMVKLGKKPWPRPVSAQASMEESWENEKASGHQLPPRGPNPNMVKLGKNPLPRPVSAQAWMEESWENEETPSHQLPPPAPPPHLEEDWENEVHELAPPPRPPHLEVDWEKEGHQLAPPPRPPHLEEDWENEGTSSQPLPPPPPPRPPPVPLEEDWENEGTSTSVLPPPPPPEEDWENESWDTVETVKATNQPVPASKSDEAPYSPNWDESSNDIVSKKSSNPPFSSQRKKTHQGRGGRKATKARGGQRPPTNIPNSWNTNPRSMNSSQHYNTDPNGQGYFNDSNTQAWNVHPIPTIPSQIYPNAGPQGYNPQQYQPDQAFYGDYQYW